MLITQKKGNLIMCNENEIRRQALQGFDKRILDACLCFRETNQSFEKRLENAIYAITVHAEPFCSNDIKETIKKIVQKLDDYLLPEEKSIQLLQYLWIFSSYIYQFPPNTQFDFDIQKGEFIFN